jgi:acetylornithine/N-succinyldiaminopimelate aminotransferase
MYGNPSADSQAVIDAGREAFMQNYAPAPVVLDRGEGARLWDTDGNEYVDLGAGISVSNFGHQDPELLAAAEAQLRKLWHVSNLYWTEPPVRLCEELVASADFARRAFLCNSGAEANEAAIKLARKWASATRGPDSREIITFEGGFHGRTLATVTATAQPKYHEGFEPLPGGFVYCPVDLEAVAAKMSERTCAVMIEPVQGEGGVHPLPEGFLAGLRKLCDEHNALLILDEVQSGLGRTGKLYAHQWEPDVVPDIMTLAKALGGGLPVGAMLAGERTADVLQLGSHGSTFGGNPVACAVARVVLRRLRAGGFCEGVEKVGEQVRARLRAFGESRQMFSEVRGRGLMIGAELREPYLGKAAEIGKIAAEHGVLVLSAGPDVVRLLPPLNIDEQALDDGLTRLEAALAQVAGA